MAAFDYRDHELHCEGVALTAIAEEVGTPVYVYSRGAIERAYRTFDEALAGIPHRVCYAVKACSTLGVLGVLVQLGAGADIVSGGELYRWLRAGGPADKVVFSGVGKTEAEIKTALEAGIGASTSSPPRSWRRSTGSRVASASARRSRSASTPTSTPETHPYISTGLKQNKFGVAMAEAPALFRRRREARGARGDRRRLPHRLAAHEDRPVHRRDRAPGRARPGSRQGRASSCVTSTSAAASASTTARATGRRRARPSTAPRCARRSRRSPRWAHADRRARAG